MRGLTLEAEVAMSDDPYHPGERRVQELAGTRELALLTARGISPHIPAPAFRFLAEQRVLVLGRASADHQCAATVLVGSPGFLAATSGGSELRVTLDPRRDRHADPVLADLAAGARVGGLVIDLTTRRRIRINGRLHAVTSDAIAMQVTAFFANCPKYIHKRRLVEAPASTLGGTVASGSELGSAERACIARADTMFVVTVDPQGEADASHRGGRAGFVTCDDGGALWIPDYPGNGMFTTLGNLATHPHAALVFWDFDECRLLHLTGSATLHVDEPDNATGGTGRAWRFEVARWQSQPLDAPFRFEPVEPSLFNP
jgi:predicted pyridoxine 5'-phosphate oxidase superfamily flavin-nucleotide-binding protein